MSALSTAQQAPATDEVALVAAVRRGDDGAFGELFSRYGRRITSYVFGMVGDYGRAEDITQEVFISALRRMRETERGIAFKPWIYEIARNACIDEFRRTKRNREVPMADDDDSDGVDRRFVSSSPAPDAALERRQQLDDLTGAFRGLSDHHHKVLVLRELEGLSYTEIGRRMGMSKPMVESTLFRARRRLNEEYEEIASGRRCEQVHAVVSGGNKAVHSLGIKERRRMARHVSHCQPCRRYALAMGLEESVLKAPGIASKVAALLPIPGFLRFWRRPGGQEDAAGASSSHTGTVLQSLQNMAQYVNPAAPTGLGRAAAAVATVVVAGGGVVGGLSATSSGAPAHPAPQVRQISGSGGPAQAAASHAAAGIAGGAVRPARQVSVPASSAGARSSANSTTTGSGQASSAHSGSQSSASANGSSPGSRTPAGGTVRSGPAVPSVPTVPRLPLPGITVPSLPNPTGLPKLPLPSVPGTVNGVTGTVKKTVGGVLGNLGAR